MPGDGAALAAAKGRKETSFAGVMISELLPETVRQRAFWSDIDEKSGKTLESGR